MDDCLPLVLLALVPLGGIALLALLALADTAEEIARTNRRADEVDLPWTHKPGPGDTRANP